MIKREEGWRESPYYCSEGYPTVGYGFLIGDKGDPLPKFKLHPKVAEAWLKVNIQKIDEQLNLHYLNLENPVRKAVLVSMAYQLGFKGLMKFKKTWEHIYKQEIREASNEMLNSKWAMKDTPARAARQSLWFRTGEYNA